MASIPVPNGDFETGDMTGWTTVAGGLRVVDAVGSPPISAYEGTYFAASTTQAGNGVSGYMLSDAIDLKNAGLSTTAIDVGNASLTVTWYQIRFDANNDTGRVGFRFYDHSGGTISTNYSALAQPSSWTQRTFTYTVPSGTRSVGIMLHSRSDTGTYPSAFFDKIELSGLPIRKPGGIKRQTRKIAYIDGKPVQVSSYEEAVNLFQHLKKATPKKTLRYEVASPKTMITPKKVSLGRKTVTLRKRIN